MPFQNAAIAAMPISRPMRECAPLSTTPPWRLSGWSRATDGRGIQSGPVLSRRGRVAAHPMKKKPPTPITTKSNGRNESTDRPDHPRSSTAACGSSGST